MYKAINGFTKSNILETIQSDFTGVSLDTKGSCMYRGKAGAMCAIGLFIPNELYSANMENKQVDGLLRDHSELINVLPLDGEALSKLQAVHDNFQDLLGDFQDESERDAACKSELLLWVLENVEG